MTAAAPSAWHLDNGAKPGQLLADGLSIVNQLGQDLFLLKQENGKLVKYILQTLNNVV